MHGSISFHTTTSVPCIQYLVCVAIDPSNTIMILLSLVPRPLQDGPGYEARYCYAVRMSTMQWTILACNIMYTFPYHAVHVLAVIMQYAIPSCSITIPPTLISIDSEAYSCAVLHGTSHHHATPDAIPLLHHYT